MTKEAQQETEQSRAGARRSQGGLDRAAIEARIPHREPFLFLDGVVFEGGVDFGGAPVDPPVARGADAPRATASWRVPESADFFRGHYPGNPLTPGVILCEHAFQAAAVLLSEHGQSFGAVRGLPVLARIEKAKFRRMVRPGETLRTEVQLVDRVGPAFFLEARAAVGGEPALEVRCVLTRVEGAR